MTEVDPACRLYEPFGGALLLFTEKAKEVLLDGPAGTGKTKAVLEKIHLCLCKYPGARALIIRKTRKSMTDSVLVTFEEKVLEEDSPIKNGASRAMRHSYPYPNRSELVVGGMDLASKIMSTEYDIIGFFEATEGCEDDWEKLTTRLRNGVMPYQQIIGDCNPSYPDHWLNQRANSGRITRILSRHEDNPTVTPSYLATLDSLTGARRERLRFGKWVAQDGLVYPEFDARVHVIDRFDIPDHWPRYRSIDFGYVNPFVCQWWAIDEDGRLYLYREIYHTKRIVEDHAKQIKEVSKLPNGKDETFVYTVADHDAEDRATLERHGIGTIAAIKEVSVGIQAVAARLRKVGEEKPTIFFLRDSLVEADPELVEEKRPTCTAHEFDSYVWAKGKDGKPKKEAPEKQFDHGLDCVKYIVAGFRGKNAVAPKPDNPSLLLERIMRHNAGKREGARDNSRRVQPWE